MKSLLFPSGFLAGLPAVGLLFLRLITGIGMAFHGVDKIQNPLGWMGDAVPAPLQFLAAFSEFFGGLAIAAGLLTPLACLGVMGTMFVAVWVHLTNPVQPTYFVKPQGAEGDSYELALMYFVMALSILFSGPGKLALDAWIFGRKK